MEHGQVFSTEEIMAREVRPGYRVIVLDEGGNWKGCGTAWKLAEEGHEVTIVTPDALIGKELQRTAADFPLRKRLAELKVRFIVESGILQWDGVSARVLSFLSSEETDIPADSLVFATVNRAFDELSSELNKAGISATAIGDCVAPRQAPYAFYDGRRVALEL
jgi:pyruvate/2-oxoglutarate dehydrogenase complex dihydrolipoamide dehydrogenase (E3) component